MKKRSLWKMFLLEIVTLGIYRLYYFIKTRREMMDRDPSIKIMSPVFLIAPIAIVIIGFVILMASAISTGVHRRDLCGTGQTPYSSYSANTAYYSGANNPTYNPDCAVG